MTATDVTGWNGTPGMIKVCGGGNFFGKILWYINNTNISNILIYQNNYLSERILNNY